MYKPVKRYRVESLALRVTQGPTRYYYEIANSPIISGLYVHCTHFFDLEIRKNVNIWVVRRESSV